MKQPELPWIAFARTLIGTAEIVGAKENPKIAEMWQTAFEKLGRADEAKKAVWRTENTPWCGAFVAYVLASCELEKHIPAAFPMARSYEKAGTKLDKPAYGCLVTFTRNGGGHVGFVVGKDSRGNLMVLGGNQGDAVNIKPFAVSRVTAYRWVGTMSVPAAFRYDLPLLQSDGKVSVNEA